jgi:hypothetical protein
MINTKTLCKIFALYCIVLVMCVNGKIYAQQFSLGIKGGPLLSWGRFGEKEDREKFGSKATLGYTAGALISFPLRNNSSFLIEGGYSKKGRRVKIKQNNWINNTTYSMIDLSMCLRKAYSFNLKENLRVDWFFNVGPEISYILSGKGYFEVNDIKYKYEILFKDDSVYDARTNNPAYMTYYNSNKWLIGLGVGVGFKFPIKANQHIITEIRFVSGHTYLGKRGTDLPDKSDQGHSFFNTLEPYDSSLQTNIKTLNISIAYLFDFDRKKSRMGKSTLDKEIHRAKPSNKAKRR